MKKLYEKNELLFAILWIVAYVVIYSTADSISIDLGIPKVVTAAAGIIISVFLLLWIWKNGLCNKYGLCGSDVPAKQMLYYFPLVILMTVNFWGGIALEHTVLETVLYIVSMLGVGFLEEIIFRGFLFRAMCRDNVNTAIIVSGVTFGIGHIVNLFNGSQMTLVSNLLQICYAVAIGLLFTCIFYKTNSLYACIVTHGVFNSMSIFADESGKTMMFDIMIAAVLCAVPIAYLVYLMKYQEDERNERNY